MEEEGREDVGGGGRSSGVGLKQVTLKHNNCNGLNFVVEVKLIRWQGKIDGEKKRTEMIEESTGG